MDENQPVPEEDLTEQETPQENTAPEKRSGKPLRRILTGVLTLLLIVLAVLVFLFRDALTGEGLHRLFGRDAGGEAAREAFTYETGSEQVFAAAGDGLAVASSSSAQLLNGAGEIVFKQVVSYDSPAVFASEKGALFCGLGGKHSVFAAPDGTSRTPPQGGDILTADMNENGWFCLVTSEAGYKALVSVYNEECEKQFEWWSGSGYVLRAAVSPDDRSLAVLCAERDCTKLHLFALNSETELAGVQIDNELYCDLAWLDGDAICVVGESGLRFFSGKGEETGAYPLEGQYLLEYELSRSGYAAIYVSAYRSGAGGTLLTLGSSGQVMGSTELERDVISLSSGGKQLLVMTAGSLALYDLNLVRQYANDALMTAKRAILRPSGDILLLHAYSAERFKF